MLESLTKDVRKVAASDKLYDLKHATEEIDYIFEKRPHRADPKFFKKAKISLLAVIKMLTHARMGGNIEVMGHFMGYFTRAGEFVVLDAVALPVEATETTVNAGHEADNFTISTRETTQSSAS